MYEDRYGMLLEDAIKKKFSGHVQRALLALLDPPVVFFAKSLKKAFKGFGTDEATVVRCLGGNTREVAKEIAAKYQQLFDKPLAEALRVEISGDFLKACLAFIEGESPTGDDIEEGSQMWQDLELETIQGQVV